MGACVFETKEILRCVEHTLAAEAWEVGYLPPTDEPGLILVHDQGIYLMSGGAPRDLINEKTSYVVYAKNCNPEKDEDWWENSRDLVGGDDFAEFIPVSADWLEHCKKHKQCCISLDNDHLTIDFE